MGNELFSLPKERSQANQCFLKKPFILKNLQPLIQVCWSGLSKQPIQGYGNRHTNSRAAGYSEVIQGMNGTKEEKDCE